MVYLLWSLFGAASIFWYVVLRAFSSIGGSFSFLVLLMYTDNSSPATLGSFASSSWKIHAIHRTASRHCCEFNPRMKCSRYLPLQISLMYSSTSSLCCSRYSFANLIHAPLLLANSAIRSAYLSSNSPRVISFGMLVFAIFFLSLLVFRYVFSGCICVMVCV